MLNAQYRIIRNLSINQDLYQFIDQEVMPGLNIKTDDFFSSLAGIVDSMQNENIQLLQIRDNLQKKIDQWHIKHQSNFDFATYKQFLQEIGYLLPEPADFSIQVDNVDDEIAIIAAPQLVVPISSARFVLNAINARWGSLYDALYVSNVIANKDKTAIGSGYNPVRAQSVVRWANDFLDKTIPLANGSYSQLKSTNIQLNKLEFTLLNENHTQLNNTQAFVGTTEDGNALIKNNNLHIELVIDQNTNAIKDVVLESAVTTIIDFEDSVASVSSSEKIQDYRNFLALMKRDLKVTFQKGDRTINRGINQNKSYTKISGESSTLSATSLMLVRNAGHHMLTDLIKNSSGNELGEGILDAMITTLISMHDLEKSPANSTTDSIYIVKPKMHGPEEVTFTVKLFSKIEKALGLKKNTIKMGIMDEERRTSINLKACIKAAKNRVIFINTGFLDRTGDEIHTSMLAGAMVAKNDIKNQSWIQAYELSNVDIGLQCGFHQQAQIGKGMWAQPDQMNEMLEQKMTHLKMGANCAWVPSPTAATLHVTHYHQFDIFKRQVELMNDNINQDDLLIIPLMNNHAKPTNNAIQKELNNNAQSILGYVVRWINQGIGCSKVQDINHIGLMEDRATLRISSQHIANWIEHKICSKVQVEKTFRAMAVVVDQQNKNDPDYVNMAPEYAGYAFQAALTLVFKAKQQPNGYTETILKEYRQNYLATSIASLNHQAV
jgi:malate synthase